jgi:predicted MFS family arabinose efflux permease
MTTGSALGTLAVLAWSRAGTLPQLYAVFLAIGVASAMGLYESAFAVVVTWFDRRGRAGALLAITIVAGFASSIFLPLTGLLVDRLGWRQALVVLAIAYGTIAIPLHALVLRRHPQHADAARRDRRAERAAVVKAAVRARPFWLLAAAFTANGGAVAVMSVLLVGYLVQLGHPPVAAAAIAGLLGVLSVTGRVVTTALGRRWATESVAAAIFAVEGAGAALLPFAGRSVPGAIGCVLLFGLGFGVGSIVRPHLLADRYGLAAYASVSSRIVMFSVVVRASAPPAAVALAQAAGYGWVMAAVGCASATAALALLAYHRLPRG